MHQVAVLQLHGVPDTDTNVATIRRLVAEVAESGAALVALPEACLFMGPSQALRQVAEPLPQGGPLLAAMQALAAQHGVWLLLGGFWETAAADRVFNTSLLIDGQGKLVASYRKLHLFDAAVPGETPLLESERVAPGDSITVADTPIGRLGLSICYDLRFPELFRNLREAGATTMAVPAAFTLKSGEAHWHTLLRARAIETQSYVIAPAQVGQHYGTRRCFGHALIVDPWGQVLADAGTTANTWVSAEIDLAQVEDVRTRMPVGSHHRFASPTLVGA